MFKAIIARREKSLQVLAPDQKGVEKLVKAWFEHKAVRVGEKVEIWEVKERLVKELNWKGEEVGKDENT